MRPLNPPALATWLLHRFGVHESLVGDLIEQHQRGRLSRWYWHQVLVAVAIAATNDLRAHKGIAALLIFISLPILLLTTFPTYWVSTAIAAWVIVYACAGLGVVLLSLAHSR